MKGAPGTVYLVGAGPGDPGLITVRGLTLLRQADVVVHDRLIGRELLIEAKPDAECVDVGKVPGSHPQMQAYIHGLLVDRARDGKVVVRLKGGDPFVFGRGFEELTACREAAVPCVVVPGVTSAIAAPEAAGIPITHRHLVRSLAIFTGSTAEHTRAKPLDYRALAAMDVIVILMGRENLVDLCRGFLGAGLSGDTPAACISRGTTPQQRVTVATLATLADDVQRDSLESPVVTVIGQVAAFARDKDVARFWTADAVANDA